MCNAIKKLNKCVWAHIMSTGVQLKWRLDDFYNSIDGIVQDTKLLIIKR